MARSRWTCSGWLPRYPVRRAANQKWPGWTSPCRDRLPGNLACWDPPQERLRRRPSAPAPRRRRRPPPRGLGRIPVAGRLSPPLPARGRGTPLERAALPLDRTRWPSRRRGRQRLRRRRAARRSLPPGRPARHRRQREQSLLRRRVSSHRRRNRWSRSGPCSPRARCPHASLSSDCLRCQKAKSPWGRHGRCARSTPQRR